MSRKKAPESADNIARPHTIKKFDLIEAYVKAWAQKLIHYPKCNGIVFIDCMCNSGVYKDDTGKAVFGTPIRVANYLSELMNTYPDKQAWCFLNDLSAEKIEILKLHLPANTKNFHIVTRTDDGNALLKAITIPSHLQVHSLLVYDPYTASIDWEAIIPFIRKWGDVIINHMVSDSIRGVSQAKSNAAVGKYEQTYFTSIQELATFGSNREAYEKRVLEIMAELRGRPNNRYYIASFPFFNTRNALVYNLIFGSSSIEGFNLFKKTAWQTFGGKSSLKDTRGTENQLILDMTGEGLITTKTDEYCYYLQDIAKYLQDKFKGRANVPNEEIWGELDEHPVFPSEGYRTLIKKELKALYGDRVFQTSITFTDRGF